MSEFEQLEHQVETNLRAGGPAAAFAFLAQHYREEKNYPSLFETRLMKKRQELGLPLIQPDPIAELPAEVRQAYDAACTEAAREVGSLYLADGDIERAWPYFRAIGEAEPVIGAIERVEPGEGIDRIIEIALHERVHPRKGFELMLANHGICRAITIFGQYPGSTGRDECLHLLIRTLHRELVESLKRAIAREEGSAPETENVVELMAGRDWLFGDYTYYVDTSHVVSILRYSLELEDAETLGIAIEIAEYGKHLSSQFQYKGEPPFEDIYVDHAAYLSAISGRDPDGGIAHFRQKLACADSPEVANAAAQLLVLLLARLERYPDAIEISQEHLRDVPASQLACPPLLQLCELAKDFDRLKSVARERGDLLSYAAASMHRNFHDSSQISGKTFNN